MWFCLCWLLLGILKQYRTSKAPYKLTDNEGEKIKVCETVLDKMDLTGIQDWDPEDQEEAGSLMREYAWIFSQHDLDLGETSLVKHSIKLTNETPFKEHYRKIPPRVYEKVKEHM